MELLTEKDLYFKKNIDSFYLETKTVVIRKVLKVHYFVTWVAKGTGTNIRQEVTKEEYEILLKKLEDQIYEKTN